ncbi:hypothetical protein DMENIID0001_150850 [Sergentomyia squamirostris]
MTSEATLLQLDLNEDTPASPKNDQSIHPQTHKDTKKAEQQLKTEQKIRAGRKCIDDKNSVISLSSSSTAGADDEDNEEEEDICLVPDISFEGINLDPSGVNDRESQPLLGGRDCPDAAVNSFPGIIYQFNNLIINTLGIYDEVTRKTHKCFSDS